jgi:hypothetical protein
VHVIETSLFVQQVVSSEAKNGSVGRIFAAVKSEKNILVLDLNRRESRPLQGRSY